VGAEGFEPPTLAV